MANTFFGLTIGSTGLYGANLGINTTAHNITNAETEGYTRQVLKTRADSPLKANSNYGMIGTGVSVYSVEQVRDQYYDDKFRSNNTVAGYYEGQQYYMDSLESYFNEIQLEGFNSNFNRMNDALQELAKDPSNLAVRTQANSYAQNFCDYINATAISLEQLQESTNFEVKTMADQINSYAVQIAGLTKQINTLEISGGTANDLRDQRNLLVDGLSNICKITVNERVVGVDEVGVTEYTVKIGNALLVDTFNANELRSVPREEKINQSDIDGLYELEWKDGQRFDGLHCGGRMQSLYEMRDGNSEQNFRSADGGSGVEGSKTFTVKNTSINDINKLHIAESGTIVIGDKEYTYNGFKATKGADGNLEYEFALDQELVRNCGPKDDVRIGQSISFKGIPYYMAQMDEFARTYAEKFNTIHNSGQDLDGNPALDYFNGKTKTQGDNYTLIENATEVSSRTGEYAPTTAGDLNASYYQMTARNFSVTKEIYDNPRKLATTELDATGPGNGKANAAKNDLVLKYIELSDDKDMFMQGTPQGFLQSLIAELGVDTHKSQNFNKSQQNIISAIQNQRLSVSGVDMDEEAMNLIRYQNSYNLAAKVISTMNEMYDKLINYMGA
ncbi:MAG: flagellar hook-associated protein FlgK [Lachnospiraceae bacterium]|nr:flagellar hook-associated protein FlgK [Lachnospiraceae bacterium]